MNLSHCVNLRWRSAGLGQKPPRRLKAAVSALPPESRRDNRRPARPRRANNSLTHCSKFEGKKTGLSTPISAG